MFNFIRSRFAIPLLAVLALAACDDDATPPPEPGTIAATAQASSDLSTLVSALVQADLVTALQGDGPFTVFAPRNAAFAALDDAVLEGLLADGNEDVLSKVLTFHVVPGTAAFSGDLSDGQTVTTLEGGELTIGVSAGGVTVNGASVVTADIEASNGVVHIIDGVLLPEDNDVYETALLTAGTTTLASAVLAAGLDDDLMGTGPFTVFAPTNAAFGMVDAYTLGALLDAGNVEILERVLGYHVIAGSEIRAADLTDGAMVTTLEGGMLTVDLSDAMDPKVNGVSIVTTDIEVANGVIHLVDEVILPEFDILETAVLTEGFSTLVAAAGAAGLEAALSDEMSDLTVFAPTDAAFEALGGTVDLLLEAANQTTLADVLLYHVLPSAVASSGLSDGLTVTTLDGDDVTFSADAGATNGFRINGADITAVDIETSNGIIHVIDAVLTEGMNVVQRAQVTEETQTLVDAVVAGDLATTLATGGPFTVFAPNNAAFEALGGTLENLLESGNMDNLVDVLTYHVIPGEYRAADLSDGAMLATVETGEVTFTADGMSPSGFKVNGANIVATDIEVSNGVIHLIDDVLFESLDIVQRAVVTEETGSLAGAVVSASINGSTDVAGILSGTGPFTVFAPVDAAFEALGTDRLDVLLDPANADLLTKVLTYHAISGDIRAADLTDGAMVTTLEGSDLTIDLSDPMMPKVNGANIIATDIVTENGVIHLVDGVLTENLDLIDVATVEGFPTLVALVEQQGLTATLRSDNMGAGFTVFAPTEAAFAALSSVPTGQALTDILTYHVLDSEVASSALSDGLVVSNTVNGASFTVNISGSDVTITDQGGNTVNVVVTDVMASNGLIHVIDGVILPTP